MDPIQQILAQAMAPKGSAGNAGSLFLQGAQLGMSRRNQETENLQRQQQLKQEQERIGLAGRRMQLEEDKFISDQYLLPYQQQAYRLQQEEAKLGIEEKTQQLARNVEIKRGNAIAGQLLLAMTRNPGLETNETFLAEAEKLFSSNAALTDTPNGKALLGSLLRPGKIKRVFEEIRKNAGTTAVTRYGVNAEGEVTASITDDPNAAARLKIARDNALLRERDLNARIKRTEASLSPELRMLLKEQLAAYSGDALILSVPEGEDELTWGQRMREKVYNDFMQTHGRGVTDMAPGQPGDPLDPQGLFR